MNDETSSLSESKYLDMTTREKESREFDLKLQKIIENDNIDDFQYLFSGSISTVYKVKGEDKIVIKVFDKNHESYGSNEERILKLLQGKPNIISLLHSKRIPRNLRYDSNPLKNASYKLILEEMDIDLWEFSNKFTFFNFKFVFREMMIAIKSCHDIGVIHCDIKPENILLNTNIIGGKSYPMIKSVKLCDFNLATSDDYPCHARGTRFKIAPEILLESQEDCDFPVDIWAAACSIIDACCGGWDLFSHSQEDNDNDYEEKDNSCLETSTKEIDFEAILKIFGCPNETEWPEFKSLPGYKKKYNLIIPKRKGGLKSYIEHIAKKRKRPILADEKLLDLLTKMIVLNPAKRLTIDQVLKHSYFCS